MSKTRSNPQIPAVPAPPRWLTRAEKAAFKRIAEQCMAAGKSVSATEVADLVTLRSRIADTRRMYKHAVGVLKTNPNWKSDQAYALACSKIIDAQTAKAQRMAQVLGLTGTGEAC